MDAARHQAVAIEAEDHDVGGEKLRDPAHDHRHEIIEADGARDRARELVERVRARLTLTRRIRLVADPSGELARQDADDEKRGQGDEVLRLRHREGQYRIHEEEVVDEDTQD